MYGPGARRAGSGTPANIPHCVLPHFGHPTGPHSTQHQAHTPDRCVVGSSPTCGTEHFGFPPVLRDWLIKGLGMSSLVYATGHIKDPVPLSAKRRGLSPGGRFPPSLIHQVIIIIMALDADRAQNPHPNYNKNLFLPHCSSHIVPPTFGIPHWASYIGHPTLGMHYTCCVKVVSVKF